MELQIAQARKTGLADAVKRTQDLIAEYSLTQSDVFGRGTVRSNKGTSVPPKYRDPSTGQTWTGRGKPPRWIQGQDRARFVL
nr:H-NS histone family protein [Xylophilus sp. ASV27]